MPHFVNISLVKLLLQSSLLLRVLKQVRDQTCTVTLERTPSEFVACYCGVDVAAHVRYGFKKMNSCPNYCSESNTKRCIPSVPLHTLIYLVVDNIYNSYKLFLTATINWCHVLCHLHFSPKMSETRITMLEEQVKSLSDELMQCQVCIKMQSKQLAHVTSDDSKCLQRFMYRALITALWGENRLSVH